MQELLSPSGSVRVHGHLDPELTSLMRDEYPPFRLDPGPDEPELGPSPQSPPARPAPPAPGRSGPLVA